MTPQIHSAIDEYLDTSARPFTPDVREVRTLDFPPLLAYITTLLFGVFIGTLL